MCVCSWALLTRDDRSEHLMSFADALDQAGEWNNAIYIYEIVADVDDSSGDYVNNRINDIQNKLRLSSGMGATEPATTVDEAVAMVRRYKGRAEDFALPISDALIDPVGANMAVVTDAILAKGFEPRWVQTEGWLSTLRRNAALIAKPLGIDSLRGHRE